MLKNKTCCFTGHRNMSFPPDEIKKRISDMMDILINHGVIYYGAGGALGFDTLAAQVVIERRIQHPQIKLILVLPCRDQTKNWDVKDIEVYYNIMQQADKIVYTSEKYHSGCMFKRNRHLVDNSSYCICYLEKETGGTAYTVNYAKEKDLKIFNLAFK